MNIIRMTGGLGNQMFSYALYLKFQSMGIDCMIDDFSEYEGHDNRRPLFLHDSFAIEYPRVTKEIYEEFTDSSMRFDKRIARKLRGRRSREYCEADANYDPGVLKQDNAYLTGYFQSEKYFADVKDEVLKAYSFTDEVKTAAERILEETMNTGCPGRTTTDASTGKNPETYGTAYVSIHVRRGDYLDVSDVYGGICTDDYYRSAIKMIMDKVSNPVFLIFSNDPEWTGNWAGSLLEATDDNGRVFNYHVIKGTDESTGYIDLCLMSRCSHNIIANSSFSWWGAYLNTNPEKIVLAPAKWNNRIDQTDIYTEYMTRI